MKHFLLLSACFLLIGSSYGQLVEIAVESYAVHDGSIAELDGMTTYHVHAVCYFDFDDNGDVGSADLLTFLSAYGSVCE